MVETISEIKFLTIRNKSGLVIKIIRIAMNVIKQIVRQIMVERGRQMFRF